MANLGQAIYTILSDDATAGPLLCAHGLENTNRVKWQTAGTPPGNLVSGTTYYVRDKTATTFKVAATSGGAAIDITAGVAGTQYIQYGPKFNKIIVVTADAATDFVTAATYRVFPDIVPQGASLPAVTFQQISGPRLDNLTSVPSASQPRFQITCFDSSHSGVRTMADAVTGAFDAYYTGGTVAGVTIQDTTMIDEASIPAWDAETEARSRYAIRQDYYFFVA